MKSKKNRILLILLFFFFSFIYSQDVFVSGNVVGNDGLPITGKLSQVMQEMGNKLRANPQAYYYPPNTNPPAGTLTDIKLDFEIPSAEAALNPNID